jgi:phage terminase large subunit-like protein
MKLTPPLPPLDTGGRVRKNSLVLIITSAGNDISGPCFAENEKARKLLNGIFTDETYFTIIYAYDDKDDWADPVNFIKANPSLGPILRTEILKNDLDDALISQSHTSDFKSKTCGIWSNATSNWIPLQTWEECIPHSEPVWDEFKDTVCCGAVDLSSVGDFMAYTLCFLKDDKYYFKHRFYIPEFTVQKRYKIENININDWISKGYVTAIPGKTNDISWLENGIMEDAEKYKIIEIAYDKWSAQRFVDEMDELLPGISFIDFDQSLKKFSGPSKDYEKIILNKQIIDTNPVMKWMVTNAVIKPTVNGDYKPLKVNLSSNKRIDGVITSIMALNRRSLQDTDVTPGDFNDILKLF